MRIAVLHNVDFQRYGPDAESREADAEIAEIAQTIAAELAASGHESWVCTVDDDTTALAAELQARGAQAVFNLVESLGGDAGREPEIPELLERARIPYTGNPAPALRMAQAKDHARARLLERGVPVPSGVVVERGAPAPELAPLGLAFPLFVKPARTDASIGIDQGSIVRSREALAGRLEQLAQRFAGPFLVETYLPGREINVAIFPEPRLGHAVCTDIDFSLCAPEVAPIVTYDCKWRPGTPDYNARSLPSAGRLPAEELALAQATARRAFEAIGGTSYGRVDLRGDGAGRYYVIDVNPNPDLHPEAGLSIAARSVGLEHAALILSIAERAALAEER